MSVSKLGNLTDESDFELESDLESESGPESESDLEPASDLESESELAWILFFSFGCFLFFLSLFPRSPSPDFSLSVDCNKENLVRIYSTIQLKFS